MDKNKIPLLVIAGPTASGKTALAVEMAKYYNGEVISADSMQIYKGLNIATAKPTIDEMQGIPHHLIDFLEPDVPFSVADYVTLAGQKIREIRSRGKLPIVCGGTGLYISSLVDNIIFDDTGSDPDIRARLEKQAKEEGVHALWLKLKDIDPETAEKVHENNLPRVIRGIEVFELTGTKLSEHKINSRREESPYKACIIGLTAENRQYLYDRIEKRVHIMAENGMVEECREVWQKGGLATAGQAIGYKELVPFFEGKAELEDCLDKIILETRHYAKRQLTWFRRVADISWVKIDNFDESKKIFENVQNIVAKSEIMCYNIM
ncbi:tRNA delta(2)-isopentenylpyrophosphate transferase [Ruminococcus albus SY3]|uniref:tRNA dimethylallyltransferase n=1 Tax=Ruminococcus albus SY3 TaxID=1341156 RepID=A0A011WLF3_RUMAL|nr:tRNA (adenosine(37)-N6)-dimethylallyltransferase MiaA [Ruminococcus albus]EXM37875.1 tRNA delta(2)-isopentenylpyrophosphate transferase [Ruminococcus albus SY3]